MEGNSDLPKYRGPVVHKEEVCNKRADSQCMKDWPATDVFLATHGPVVEYQDSTESYIRPVTKSDQLSLNVWLQDKTYILEMVPFLITCPGRKRPYCRPRYIWYVISM